jgi:hypothetical protein
MNVRMKVHSARQIEQAHFHVNWSTYGEIGNDIRSVKKRLRGSHSLTQRASASRSGHARVNDAQRVRAHKARMSLPSKTADDTLYRRHGATSDDVALLITAMRSNVEHPGEDARPTVRQKHSSIRRPITRVRCRFSRADLAMTTATKRNV